VNTGLTNGNVFALAIDPAHPATIYAGTQGGVFKSSNGGENWSSANIGLTTLFVSALANDPANPGTVFLTASGGFGGSGGVFKSINGGAVWTRVNLGDFRALAIDPANSNTVYAAGTTGVNISKSTDGGASWVSLNTTPTFSLAIDPTTPATIYAGGPFGVSKSIDGGINWNSANVGLPGGFVNALAIDPVATMTVYAGTGAGVFKSTSGGASWQPTGANGGELTVLIDIKPGSDQNTINLKSRGKIPVAILSDDTSDAMSVDPTTLTFGRTGDEDSLAFCNGSPGNVNADKLRDLLCFFNSEDTGFQTGDTEGVLKGTTLDGTPITGSDEVRIVR
jgi:photosystem II stability/assembly factor-like uncharacterized protein